jgi:hypothetical protein
VSMDEETRAPALVSFHHGRGNAPVAGHQDICIVITTYTWSGWVSRPDAHGSSHSCMTETLRDMMFSTLFVTRSLSTTPREGELGPPFELLDAPEERAYRS